MKKLSPYFFAIAFLVSLVFFVPAARTTFLDFISRAYAAVFDSDLIPSLDNQWNVGLPFPSRWKDARFSGIVGIGIDSAREGEVNVSDRLVLGPTDIVAGEGGQIKLLGISNNKYTILDNYNNDLRILTRDGVGGELERVRVTNAGSVLIGTSSTMVPGEKLEVVGNIISKGTTWATSTSAADNNWNSVTYGNGLFVAVASSSVGNRVMTSPDGINWTLRSSAIDNAWSSVTYGNGLFVAVAGNGGSGNRAMTSPDGINWTSRVTPADQMWRSVTYGNGLFVAVAGGPNTGGTNRVMTSPDGINWTPRPSSVTINNRTWQSVTYGNGLFVAVSDSGALDRAMTSPDGINWTQRTTTNNSWNSVTYGNGLFVAVARIYIAGNFMTSPDGITWTFRSNPDTSNDNFSSITYGNGLFVAVPSFNFDGKLLTSPDGINWTFRPTPTTTGNSWQSVTYGNGLFVAVASTGVGNRVMTSGKPDYQITPHNNIYQGGMSIMGSSTGILGIGTTNPSRQLEINGVSSEVGLQIENSAPGGKAWGLVSTSGGNLDIQDDSDSSPVFRLDGASNTFSFSGGNVGIGTFSPQTSLHIEGSNPRLALFDNDVGISASNPAWVLRSDNTNGTFRIQYHIANYVASSTALIIDSSGNVGIGRTPTANKLEVEGNASKAAAGSWLANSDIRIKTDVHDIENALTVISRLHPVKFKYTKEYLDKHPSIKDTYYYNYIAQEFQKVFPDSVQDSGEDGLLQLDSYNTNIYLVKAVQELLGITKEQELQLKTLENQVNSK